MNELLEWIISAGVLFVMALILFFYGIYARSRKFFYSSFIMLFLSLCAGGWTAWLFLKKSYKKLETLELPKVLEARSGPVIYEAIFGKDSSGCVEVLNRQDQVIPRLDCCILLEFNTCPSEVRRIIHQAGLQESKEKWRKSDFPSDGAAPDWFRPEYLGEDQRKFISDPDNPLRQQTLIISPDSSRAFYCDVAD